MKIPKTLKVGGFSYKIIEDSRYLDAKNRWGEANHEELTIYLKAGVPKDYAEETFLHEILHTCFEQSKLGDLLTDKKMTEEDVVTVLSPMLYQVLKENKLDFYHAKV